MKKVALTECGQYDIDLVKKSLEELFCLLGYDQANPLGNIIKPGMRVFIKPNWVASRWRQSCSHSGNIYSVITHPSIVEAVADYVAIALHGKGEIIIGDNPSIDADFNELMQLIGILKLETKYNIPCKIMDLRPFICDDLKKYGKKELMTAQRGDPLGFVEVNLAEKSMLYNCNPRLFRGIFDDRRDTINSHKGNKQMYSFSGSLYNADVYISIPKMKTHHKVGTTLNLKGLVGSIANKNQLVHWKLGFPLIGGDEYPNFIHWFRGLFAKVKERGAWYGNDTIWRMVVDLYNAFMQGERKYFSIVDGIIAGEKKGPFCPYEKQASVLIAGEDLLAVDIATTRLMGFLPNKIKYLKHFLDNQYIQLQDIQFMSNSIGTNAIFESNDPYYNFSPPEGWENIKV
ncbi:DUF362 domain-containing protein [Sporomusa sphaeroides]|uniref:DUF362 domain-containing protein n=1 Tax=Sporomusa sphaeroides TaxID=47679 RepID=UPI002BEBA561|nr:DUF362 domain-containing protein [Sporomusa sphaeroides]HML34229.1 DUF362 domain-containing protein [Sporomusa sphaeroides]